MSNGMIHNDSYSDATPRTSLKPTQTTLVPAAASLSMVTDAFSLGYTSSTESEALRAEYITLGVDFALTSYTWTRQLRGL
jgi:hypothetical protein